ncbi:hypothetical protein GY45DRAFT_1328834 [Cubamyces sp. BRFM 1775]|nr:hypothetical protein GY45DRAFT_1328834 [Cubamyces sp. BRFM 1775]
MSIQKRPGLRIILLPIGSPSTFRMSTNTPKPPALDNTYGALLLGSCFGMMLYGLTIHQTYRYFRLYPKDRLWIKALIAGILLLDTLHTVLCIVAVYYHLVTHYFDPASLAAGHWSTRILTLAMGLTIVLCQCFYVHRVYQLGSHYGYKLLVFIAIACMVCEFAFLVATTVEVFRLSLDQFPRFSWLVSATFGCIALAEFFLTGTLIVALLRSRTGLKRTDSTIEVLIVYSVNTGLISSIFDLLCFVFALILPGNLIYVGFGSVGVKLYANSVLAVLNSRHSLSERMMEDFELGSFEPKRIQAERAAGSSDAPVDNSKLQHRVGARLLTMTNMSFASMPVRSQTDYSSEDSTVP